MSLYNKGIRNVPPVRRMLPNEVSNRIDHLVIGTDFWKQAEDRFYKIGINPLSLRRNDITSIRAIDGVANIAIDFAHVGMLLLGVSAIRTAIA